MYRYLTYLFPTSEKSARKPSLAFVCILCLPTWSSRWQAVVTQHAPDTDVGLLVVMRIAIAMRGVSIRFYRSKPKSPEPQRPTNPSQL